MGRTKPRAEIVADYYEPAFLRYHDRLAERKYSVLSPHRVRSAFWSLRGPCTMVGDPAREALDDYNALLEQLLAAQLSPKSVAFWVHLYRRIFPGTAGPGTHPATVLSQRATFEAAIQKYARIGSCDYLRLSNTIFLDEILDGDFDDTEARWIQRSMLNGPQWVMAHFTDIDLQDFYDLEKLAYEIWRTSAQRRAIGKGAILRVTTEAPFVHDERTEELEALIASFDDRIRAGTSSSAGITYPDPLHKEFRSSGGLLAPAYNVSGLSARELNPLYQRLHGVTLPDTYKPNIIWLPFNIRGYYEAHRPLASAFSERHGVSLEAVISLIVAELYLIAMSWKDLGPRGLRDTRRGYDLARSRDQILEAIVHTLPDASKIAGIDVAVGEIDLTRAMDFMTLTEESRANVSLPLHGPHQMYVPIGQGGYIVDYMYIHERLYNLFFDVSIPDQNFKGDALEAVTRDSREWLPTSRLKGADGTSRQIDANARINRTLFIVECRASSKSFGFERGDPKAIKFRTDRIDAALTDVDEKAKWLSLHREGKNFSLQGIERIVPIAVTPFVEYIPSRDRRWWLKDNLPRVLTPIELRNMLDREGDNAAKYNVVEIA